MPHVFISYSRRDTSFVETLERDLNARGIVTWRDTSSIVGGEEWYKAIVRGIHDAYAMVQIVTSGSNESKWVLREALYALQRNVPVIPVMPRLHPVPFHLIETQPVLCDPYAEGFARLVAGLGILRDTVSAVAPTPTSALGPTDHDTELAYLDFVLAEMEADLWSARYVTLGATRDSPILHKPSPVRGRGEFDLDFGRLAPLVKAERLHGDDLTRPGEPVADARDPLREMSRAILLGDPGSGKTTTLQQLAIDLARVAQSDPNAPLPVFVPLRSYSGETPFAEFVRGQLGPLQSQYERLLRAGRLVPLCDALNEMQRSGNGRNLVDEVRAYLRDQQSWVVSCRVRDYQEELQGLPNVGKVRLKPLDLPRIKQVIDRRFHREPERAAALWADLTDSTSVYDRRMMQLCRNPFMLFMVCATFERLGHLPPNRGALFATFVDNLLRREELSSHATGRDWIETSIIRRALAELAYAMQRSETGTEITRTEAEDILKNLSDVPDLALLLRLAASASLLDVGERVRYTHQLLQEYFASEVMGAALDEKRSPTEYWPAENWWERQGWEETAVILAGVRGDPESVARWIAPAQPVVAYQALTECGIDVDVSEIQPETRAALVDGVNAKTGEPDPIGRATAYRFLALLDADHRSGIGLRADGLPDIDWVEIPAGEFIFGDDSEKNGPVTLFLPTFYIARYPITYVQFQAFLDASDGFEHDRWWADLTPEYRGRQIGGQVFRYSYHPRDNTYWGQAVAFCHWLSANLDFEVTLPTEQQWEKAARGTAGYEYPSGWTFDTAKGNTWETGIRETSAVGIFPKGMSFWGVLDMSGNLWEWCLNEYENSNNIGLKSDAPRVLRGGSWKCNVHLARCNFRDRPLPYISNIDKGFRVVCTRPSP